MTRGTSSGSGVPGATRPAKGRHRAGRSGRSARRDYRETNLSLWERQSRAYDTRFAQVLGGRRARAWGLWRRPESSLRLLGSVQGKRTLEVGCGAARWSLALAAAGAHAVGLDFSTAQLTQARRLNRRSRRGVDLVRGTAEKLPFRRDRFDRVLSDWGAMTFADPRRTIPECARVLRPGGRLVFATASPIASIARDRWRDRITRRLQYAYFDLHRVDFPREVDFQMPYGGWIEQFGRHGLAVEGLIETRPGARERSAYLGQAEERWARRWPLECIWVLRKRVPAGGGRRTGLHASRATSAPARPRRAVA